MADLTFGPWCSGVVVNWEAVAAVGSVLSATATSAAVVVALSLPRSQREAERKLSEARRSASEIDLAMMMVAPLTLLRVRLATMRGNLRPAQSGQPIDEQHFKKITLSEIDQLERFVNQVDLLPDPIRKQFAFVISWGMQWNVNVGMAFRTDSVRNRYTWIAKPDSGFLVKHITPLRNALEELMVWAMKHARPSEVLKPIVETEPDWLRDS